MKAQGTSPTPPSRTVLGRVPAADRAIGAPRANGDWLRSLPRRVWLGLLAIWAAVTALLPHVLHHAGPLAGAALFAGVAGSLLFGALGLLLMIPFLRRMYRRFGTWRAPALALALFVAVFALSTLVIAPQISGEGGTQSTSGTPASEQPSPSGHEAHHE